MHRDTIIGIVGVVILVAAMVGVFTYESGQAANLVPGEFVLATLAGPTLEGTTALDAETAEAITVSQTNMTNLTFTLSWSSTATAQNTLQLEIRPANGTGLTEGFVSEAESDGEISITLPIGNEKPTSGPLARGVGDYEILVRFLDSRPPGAPIQPPQPVPPTASWTLATSIDAYEQAPTS